MRKIAFFCIPAHGHTNPTLPVVRSLVDRGHAVRYYGYNSMKESIEKTGAEYIALDPYDNGMHLAPEDADRISRDIAFAVEVLVNTTLALDDAIIEDMRAWGTDCIVADSMATWGKLAAQKLDVPFVSSTTTFAFNRYSARIMPQDTGSLFKMLFALPRANRAIRRLQAKGYPVKNFLSVIQNDNDTHTIVYTSPAFQPFSETFSEKYAFVGPSLEVPEKLPPKCPGITVYISLGTVNNHDVSFFRNAIKAFTDTNWEIILSVGERVDIDAFGSHPKNITIQRHVNQMEVLSRADVFLTHCGMNSVSEALYWGVPLVLFPQTTEQGGVAKRAFDMGAGLYLQANTPEVIRSTTEAVLSCNSYRENALKISEGFKACGGAAAAADKILTVASY